MSLSQVEPRASDAFELVWDGESFLFSFQDIQFGNDPGSVEFHYAKLKDNPRFQNLGGRLSAWPPSFFGWFCLIISTIIEM